METETQNQAEQANGTKAPTSAMLKQATAETLSKQEQEIAALQSRIVALEGNQKPVTVKKAATNAELEKAITTLEAKNKASLSSDSPKLDLSLSGQLGFVPIFSKEQREDWNPRRDSMRAAHTAAWKARSAVVIGHLKRAVRMPQAVMAGGLKTRKTDGAIAGVSLRASNLAKPLAAKGKGKNGAKPAQVAGKASVAGNANPPAKL